MTQTMTEADARRILAEVEPKHAAWEREYSIFAGKGFVDLRPHLKGDPSTVPLADWRPRATRTPSGWAVSGGWLDAPVPSLPTTHAPSCAVRPVQPDASDSLWDRYGTRVRVMWSNMASLLSVGELIGETIGPLAQRGGDHVPSDAARETRGLWHRERMDARAFPANGVGRGWCEGLNGNINSAQPVTDKGWRMMQTYCASYLRTTDAAWAAERAELTQLTGAA